METKLTIFAGIVVGILLVRRYAIKYLKTPGDPIKDGINKTKEYVHNSGKGLKKIVQIIKGTRKQKNTQDTAA